MNNLSPASSQVLPPKTNAAASTRWRNFFIAVGIVVVAFCLPLVGLIKFSLGTELFSHVVLIPFVTIYFIWLQRGELPPPSAASIKPLAVVCFTVGAAALAGSLLASNAGITLVQQDRLALQTLSFVAVIIGVCACFFTRSTLSSLAFPLGFLVFMAPFPVAVVSGIETFFQHTSASAAASLFQLAGTPFYREGTYFQLPGINLEVAPECSGIRSSLALFITSLVAGHLFLRTTWKRVVLVALIIPLGIIRNGFRIFTIGELCVHIRPEMIDSWIHRHGGPVFFAASLIPFSLLLVVLARSDRSRPRTPEAVPLSSV